MPSHRLELCQDEMNAAVGQIVSEGSAYIERATPELVINILRERLSNITLRGKVLEFTEDKMMSIWLETFKVPRPESGMDDEDIANDENCEELSDTNDDPREANKERRSRGI
jgi:hypothetical protein